MIEHLKWLGRRLVGSAPRAMQPAVKAWSGFRIRQMVQSGEYLPEPATLVAYEGYHRAESGEGIPRLMHQIWTHPPLPDGLAKFHQTVLDQHPDTRWEHRMWTIQDMEALVAEHFPQYEEAYHALPRLIYQIDVVRLMILVIHGGVYLDLDYLCTAPFDDLLDDCRLCLSSANDTEGTANRLSNFFLAASPDNALMRDCLAEILDRPIEQVRGYNEPIRDTGPQLLTRVWRKKKDEYGAKILPRVVLSIPAEYYYGGITPPKASRGYHVCTGTWRGTVG